MTKEEIRKHPRNNILTCALGSDADMLPNSIESYRLDAEDNDLYLLFSDGLSVMLSDMEMEDILVMDGSVDHIVNKLLVAVMESGGRGIISLILVKS